jgi:ubiquinone/menaquinone biosynthesis C-methylase UbiE
MTKPRIPETDRGIQGEFNVTLFDRFQRRMRDKGYILDKELVKRGIASGCALEIGPGPGYLGLEWLKRTAGTTLKGLDISKDMIAVAQNNANEYCLNQRVEYVHGNGDKMPFADDSIDAAFSSGSLHEWENPRKTFDEIWRILKPGGVFFISDLRRDMNPLLRWFLWIQSKPKWLRDGLLSSIKAAYTPDELRELIQGTKLENGTVAHTPIGLKLIGRK